MKLLRNLFVSIAAMWALLVLAGCATDSGYLADPGQTSATNAVYAPGLSADVTGEIIRPQEQLTIELLDIGQGVQKLEQTVAEDGTIILPLINDRVPAAGKKIGELQDAIRDLYVPRFYKRMTVNIKRDNRYYFVRGQVKTPGQRLYTGDMTVTRAIASAGDFNDYAKKTKVQVIRSNGRTETVNAVKALKDSKKDLPIYPGDTVFVPLSVWGTQ
jgi:polysaccharide biosynthesis/export protein